MDIVYINGKQIYAGDDGSFNNTDLSTTYIMYIHKANKLK